MLKSLLGFKQVKIRAFYLLGSLSLVSCIQAFSDRPVGLINLPPRKPPFSQLIACSLSLSPSSGKTVPIHPKSMTSFVSNTSPYKLVKSDYESTLDLAALVISAKLCNDYLATFKDFLFDRPRMKRIYPLEGDDSQRLLLLRENLDIDSLPINLRQYHNDHGSGRTTTYSVNIAFDSYNVEEILRMYFQKNNISLQEIPSSFEMVGHIAHVNLRPEALEYKYLIGEVILVKNKKALKTVVNKVSSIENVYRTFPLEVLAGDTDLEVTLKESGAIFTFNFGEVYWNSRLQAAHLRLIHAIRERSRAVRKTAGSGLVVADMTAGVGPFAVPLAMVAQGVEGPKVFANDLNPRSYHYLTQNAQRNKCAHNLVPCNLDAREFLITKVLPVSPVHECILNLPALSLTFLDTFIGLKTRYEEKYKGKYAFAEDLYVTAFAFSRGLQCPMGEEEPAPTHAEEAAGKGVGDGWEFVYDVMKTWCSIMGCSLSDLMGVACTDDSAAAIMALSQRDSNGGMGIGMGYSYTFPCCSGYVVRDVAPRKVMVSLRMRIPDTVLTKPYNLFDFELESDEGGSLSKKRSREEGKEEDDGERFV
eukprot:gene27554-33280_t